jgi:putative FmdB family regulatory protein
MPIYAYRCTACGHAKDVLQKVTDAPLEVCPACGASAFTKQVTAAGFQLKGSGWYVTDFRGGSQPPAAKPESTAPTDSGKTEASKDSGSKSGGSSDIKATSTGTDATPPPAPPKAAAGGN